MKYKLNISRTKDEDVLEWYLPRNAVYSLPSIISVGFDRGFAYWPAILAIRTTEVRPPQIIINDICRRTLSLFMMGCWKGDGEGDIIINILEDLEFTLPVKKVPLNNIQRVLRNRLLEAEISFHWQLQQAVA